MEAAQRSNQLVKSRRNGRALFICAGLQRMPAHAATAAAAIPLLTTARLPLTAPKACLAATKLQRHRLISSCCQAAVRTRSSSLVNTSASCSQCRCCTSQCHRGSALSSTAHQAFPLRDSAISACGTSSSSSSSRKIFSSSSDCQWSRQSVRCRAKGRGAPVPSDDDEDEQELDEDEYEEDEDFDGDEDELTEAELRRAESDARRKQAAAEIQAKAYLASTGQAPAASETAGWDDDTPLPKMVDGPEGAPGQLFDAPFSFPTGKLNFRRGGPPDEDYRLANRANVEPDFEDPEWVSKVTNWTEFWTYSRWEDEVEGISGDEADPPMDATRAVEKADAMIAAIRDSRLRTDVQQWLPAFNDYDPDDGWETPPVPSEREDPFPALSMADARAIAEKARYKELMDEEWQHRKSLVGSIAYSCSNNERDERLQKFRYLERDNGREWTAAEIRQLITQNGLAAPPEAHKGIVENPLVPIDYVNTMGVRYIEETEELLDRLGHLATPAMMARFGQEIVFTAKDFTDGAVFTKDPDEDDEEYEDLDLDEDDDSEDEDTYEDESDDEVLQMGDVAEVAGGEGWAIRDELDEGEEEEADEMEQGEADEEEGEKRRGWDAEP